MNMLSKREKLFAAADMLDVLCCPVCGRSMTRQDQRFVCGSGHSTDANKKGYLYLLNNTVDTYYDADLFAARSRVFSAGCYDAVIRAVEALLPSGVPHRLLDAGCGDGWYLDRLLTLHPDWKGAGVDISRDAISSAACRPCTALWCVGDLRQLPFRDRAFTAVLDILTPAGYTEFRRVLAPDGVLIKVFPGSGYLKQLRAARGMSPYTEGQVGDYLHMKAQVLSEQQVTLDLPVTPDLWRDFVWMTPLNQDLSPAEKDIIAGQPDTTVTIDLHVAACKL